MNIYCAVMIPTIESRIIGGFGIIRGGVGHCNNYYNRGVGVIVCVCVCVCGGGEGGWTGLNK